ncbi:MAG: sigma-70 family RNA polymerase sigma factor [Polyangiaceae bacterium]
MTTLAQVAATAPRDMAELVVAARKGDTAASRALWAHCSTLARRIARRWTSNLADAEDISQEALLYAFKDLDSVRDPTALVGWLQVVIVRAAARNARQRDARRVSEANPDSLVAHDAPPDSQVECRRLIEFVGRLPDELRDCLWLRRGEGLSIAEVAQETELSAATVYRRMHVADERLARMVRGRPSQR